MRGNQESDGTMKFLALLFLFSTAFASTIPLYEIESIAGNEIRLTNDAIFNTQSNLELNFRLWRPGDKLMIANLARNANLNPAYIQDEQFMLGTLLNLQNTSFENDRIVATLTQAPTVPSKNTFSICSIDTVKKIVILSNGSKWEFSDVELPQIDEWEVGQTILIGKESLSFVKGDAILLNVDNQGYICVNQL